MHPRYILCSVVILFSIATAHAGAWGHKSFQNDDALDWVENSLKTGGQSAVERAVLRVAKGRGYLEAPEASYAIAACEVLAAAQGRSSPDLPEEVAILAKTLPSTVKDEVRKSARDAIERVLGDQSELNELWMDSKDFQDWKKCVESLKTRI